MRGLNLDHLRMFAQVAELGSFPPPPNATA